MSPKQDIQSLWAAIADREAHLLALVKASAQIVWVTDQDGNVLDADPPQEIADLTWATFTGLSQETLRGHGWAAALHPDDRETLTAVTMHSRQTGEPVNVEFRVRHVSGEWRWLLCHGNAVRDRHGAIVGWIGSCSDITSGKKTEEALRDSQQRLMAALEAGLISTWIWRVSDNTFWWDEAGEKLWGVDSTQPHTHDIGELLALVHPEDRPSIEAAIAKTVATGIAHGAEFRTLRRDGKLQWLSSRGRVEKDANGNIECVVGAFADITKLKAAEESLRHAQKMQALGTLAGGIAHDFNNLLLAINGNARLALDDVSREHASYRSLQEISKAATRATDLVRRILSFAARQPFAPATTPIMPAVEEALKLLELSMPRNIAVQVRCDDATLACALGAAELQQAIVNLSNNAVHAIGNRDGRIEIDVSSGGALPAELTQPADHYARIEVRDNGCGMDATTRARVFDPFFTTKPTGKGTGLGLAVVHGVVQGCGGAITVASELNRGSTFTLWLPLAGTVTIPALPADAAKRGGGEHILYVDDDEAINFLIQRLLEQLGYRVTCCDDPTHAQRLFAADPHSFDIVVTDLSMPTMSGFDLILALKKIRNDVPTVLTSGYVREDDHARAINLGVDHVILKPNTIDELGHALDALCKRLRARA